MGWQAKRGDKMTEKKKSPEFAPPELWERQKGESAPAFQAFAIYRDMGAERSLAKVAQKLGKSKALMERWSRRWQWGVRAEAWDDEMDCLTCRELQKGVAEMRKNHVGIAKAMLVKALQALQKIPTDEISPRDVANMVDVAAKLERISRGEVTERTEGKQTIAGEFSLSSIDLSRVSDEELKTLDAITGKIFAD